MNNELDRIKQDLKTMEAVLGREPELDRRHVWQGVAFGIWGAVYAMLGSLPFGMNRFVAAGIAVVLLIALPACLPRLVCGELPPAPPGDKDLNHNSMGFAILALCVGIVFWCSHLTVPKMMVPALTFLVGGLWALFLAWGRPWRRGLLAFAVAFLAVGFAAPFLPHGTFALATGLAMIFGGFVGAAILHLQLREYYAHGKAAH